MKCALVVHHQSSVSLYQLGFSSGLVNAMRRGYTSLFCELKTTPFFMGDLFLKRLTVIRMDIYLNFLVNIFFLIISFKYKMNTYTHIVKVKSSYFVVLEHVCIVIYSRNKVEESLLNIPVFQAMLYQL